MTNKQVGIIGVVVALLAVVGYVVWSNMSTSNDATTEADTSKSFTSEEVAKHDNESDCWTIIDGSVYEITSYISQHPNNEILRACGIDGSSLFDHRTTKDGETVGSGTPHDSEAQAALEQLKVGTLAN